MTYDMTHGTAKFERMTKEEKLRFCQHLIKQAANLTKSSDTSTGIYSTGSKSSLSGVRSTSKSSKRPLSPSGILSKKTKSGTISPKSKSKPYTKTSTSQRTTSKSHHRQKSKAYTNVHSTTEPDDSKSKAASKKSIRTSSTSGIRSSAKTGTNIRSTSKSTTRSKKSKSKQHHTSKIASHSSLNVDGMANVHSTSPKTDKHTHVKNSTAKTESAADLCVSTIAAPESPAGMCTKSGTVSKSKVHSQSQQAPVTSSSVRSITASKSNKNINKTKKALESNTKKKPTTSTIRTPMTNTSDTKSQLSSMKNTTKSSMKSKEKSQSKHSHKRMKDHTETCAVQFVPKFNPNSNKNPVPIYQLIRHAFGNMVREAICQLDKEKSGVSSQEIIDHILKYYSFPTNVSESAIRNRTIFTINAGLRAGTLLSINPNKDVRIGRMRRVYPRMLR